MSWSFVITHRAENNLDNLDAEFREIILSKLEWFAENFDQAKPDPLHGDWRGFFKLRVGDWRIVYEIDYQKKILAIHAVKHRRDVYRR